MVQVVLYTVFYTLNTLIKHKTTRIHVYNIIFNMFLYFVLFTLVIHTV